MSHRLPAALALTACLGLAAPAGAHTALQSSSPAAGAVVSSVPARVTLTFSATVARLLGAKVVDGTGVNVATGARRAGSRKVVIGVKGRRTGRYTVTYRMVASDGDVQSGNYTFTVRK